MTIFTRYIASIQIRLLMLCYGAFASIYLVIDILERVGKLTRSGGRPDQILLFFLWKLPEISIQIIPLAVLMATLLALGSLSRTSEITAMRCSGAGLLRITAPLLGIALVASLINLALSEIVVPSSFEKMRYIEEVQIKKKNPNTFFRQGAIWYRDHRDILNARMFDPDTATLRGITIWQVGENLQPIARIEATEGKLQGDSWQLSKAILYRYSSSGITQSTKKAGMKAEIKLSTTDLKTVGKLAENMGFVDLYNYCDNLQKGGYDPTRYLTLLHAKLAAPFSPIVMAFLAIPFSIRTGRSSGPAIGIGLSLVIGLAYFIVNAFLISFGQAGALPPLVSAWAANIIFCAIGIWLALTINR
ncbi:LPS export ABC transporter permease LptG [Geobacter pelophilus]|uniref:LPS export ABC transporter permease LptG n=1 Tax=Geoanaerobacter pelophilus TaxID=60036 RepID=A0AAW4L7N8_9BACT|nr:LPS export ABC transporter permease LptG [Geoanaerobacter pelophilus]MBT0663251.1 LPS export ABC transporter permease LptG [Geoanaerobacter pelophilus]